jgi:hypothetical protein
VVTSDHALAAAGGWFFTRWLRRRRRRRDATTTASRPFVVINVQVFEEGAETQASLPFRLDI